MINIKEIAEMIINQKQFEQEDFMWLVHNSEVLARAYLELEKKISEAPIYDIHVLESEITKLKKSRDVLRTAVVLIENKMPACDCMDAPGIAREAIKADDEIMGGK